MIRDQEALGFGSFRQMNKDADPQSVSVSADLQQGEKVGYARYGSGHLAQRARSQQQELFCFSVPHHFVVKKHNKTWFAMGIQKHLQFSTVFIPFILKSESK